MKTTLDARAITAAAKAMWHDDYGDPQDSLTESWKDAHASDKRVFRKSARLTVDAYLDAMESSA